MNKILIVEDNTLLNKTLSYNLKLEGYQVTSCHNFFDTLEILQKESFSLILLDVNLPDGNGFDLCNKIRKHNIQTYIIFLTACDRESDMLRGYELGGNDYIAKPFSITVLCKKIASILKDINQRMHLHDTYDDGNLYIDFSEQVAKKEQILLDLTPKEYQTLKVFITHPRIILTKRQLMESLWEQDSDYVDEHTLATIISRIRKKIESEQYKYIKTTYGIGYQWIGRDKNE